MNDHEQLFQRLLGDEWRLVGDPARFLYAAQSFAAAQATQDWVQGWSDILHRAPYFAEPNDRERLNRAFVVRDGEDPSRAIELYEAEGESLTVYILAERSNMLTMDPQVIPGWLSNSRSTLVASLGLYAMGAHGAQWAALREWQRLDRLIRDTLDSIADSLRADPALWWNVLTALRFIFQVRNKDPVNELFATLNWAYAAAARSLAPRLDCFLEKFSPDTPYAFHCVLIHILKLELDPPTTDRLLGVVFGRIEVLRRERFLNLPRLAETYIDLYFSNLLGDTVLYDEATRGDKDRGWLRRQLFSATLPERDWDRSHDVIQRARWGLWLLGVGSIAALKTPPDAEGSNSTLVHTLIQIGVHHFWSWQRYAVGSDDLSRSAPQFFVQAAVKHAHVANEMNALEALVLAAGSPVELELVHSLMTVLPDDGRDRAEKYTERLMQWWNRID